MTDKPWLEVSKATKSRIIPLQSGYTRVPRDSAAVRNLANLRHADINSPGVDPTLWEVTLGSLPHDLLGHGDDPSPAERAVHAALVLYATHQQSRPEPMHRSGIGLGQAVRSLSQKRSGGPDWDTGTISRFHHLCRAQSSTIRLENLRGLVTLLRSESVGLDYGRLAADLYRLEKGLTQQVILSWGRQLHRMEPTTHDNPDQSPDIEGAQK